MTEKCLKKQVLSTTGVANRSIAECQLVDCIWFLHGIDKLKYLKRTFLNKYIFQKVYQIIYPSIGWSPKFFGASCDAWP